MNICIIPARGGSKRIIQKNTRLFCGLPIISWSIQAALDSDCFNHVIVSTDDPHIARTAEEYGATVPFIRPENLADDITGILPVIRHAINWLENNDKPPTMVCQLLATAPFVRPEDLKLGMKLSQNSDFALSVCEFGFPIQRAVRILDNGRLQMFQPENFEARSQDLPPAYHDAGQFCIGKTSSWKQGLNPFGSGTVPVILPRHRVQDIDTHEDWYQAELMFKIIAQQNLNPINNSDLQ